MASAVRCGMNDFWFPLLSYKRKGSVC